MIYEPKYCDVGPHFSSQTQYCFWRILSGWDYLEKQQNQFQSQKKIFKSPTVDCEMTGIPAVVKCETLFSVNLKNDKVMDGLSFYIFQLKAFEQWTIQPGKLGHSEGVFWKIKLNLTLVNRCWMGTIVVVIREWNLFFLHKNVLVSQKGQNLLTVELTTGSKGFDVFTFEL